jgi:hypothetical protein
MLGHLSAIVTFLIGIFVSVLIVRPLKAWPSWPLLRTIKGMEVILIVAASLALAAGVAHGVEIFVLFVSLALGLQNGAFRRAGGISVHTTSTVLPNGRTVGSYVSQLSNSLNQQGQVPPVPTPYGPTPNPSSPGPISVASQVFSGTNFRQLFRKVRGRGSTGVQTGRHGRGSASLPYQAKVSQSADHPAFSVLRDARANPVVGG